MFVTKIVQCVVLQWGNHVIWGKGKWFFFNWLIRV